MFRRWQGASSNSCCPAVVLMKGTHSVLWLSRSSCHRVVLCASPYGLLLWLQLNGVVYTFTPASLVAPYGPSNSFLPTYEPTSCLPACLPTFPPTYLPCCVTQGPEQRCTLTTANDLAYLPTCPVGHRAYPHTYPPALLPTYLPTLLLDTGSGAPLDANNSPWPRLAS